MPLRPISIAPWLCTRARQKNSSPCARNGDRLVRSRTSRHPALINVKRQLVGRLQDEIALVTGAGNGIGRATAERFAAESAFVYVTDLDGAAAEKVAAGIVAKGGTAAAAAMDVSKGQDVSAVMRRVKAD